MNTATQNETKRRGRPPKVQDADNHVEDASPLSTPEDEEVLARVTIANPPCHRCGKPLEKSVVLLRAYGLATYRCVGCRHVAIENDTQWYDFATAVSGDPPLLVERAAALYASRNSGPLGDVPAHGIDDAILSDSGDVRWDTVTL